MDAMGLITFITSYIAPLLYVVLPPLANFQTKPLKLGSFTFYLLRRSDMEHPQDQDLSWFFFGHTSYYASGFDLTVGLDLIRELVPRTPVFSVYTNDI